MQIETTGNQMISVIVTTYNAAPWIVRVIESLQAQTYDRKQIEIVVVDDGSRDDTVALVERLARDDERIRLIRQQNQGTAGAVTRGLQEAQGAIVCLLSHDCFAEPAWLQRVADAFASDARLGIVRGAILPAGPLDIPFFHCMVVDHDSRSFEGACIAYRASAVDDVGRYFDRELSRYGDDADMAWRILGQGHTYRWLPLPPTAYHAVVPRPWWASIRSTPGVYRFALLLKKRPAMRSRLWRGFLWGSRYRYLKMLGLHTALLAGLMRRPRAAGAGAGLLLAAMAWHAAAKQEPRVAPIHRWLTMPLVTLLNEWLGTYAFMYGSVKYRSPIL